MQPQAQDQWCWAAVAVSTSLFYPVNPTGPWTQCVLVNQQLNQTTCCVDGGNPNTCNVPSQLDTALGLTGNLLTWVGAPLSAAIIQQQLGAGRVIGCRIGWSGTQNLGHFVVISGYVNDGTVETVTVEDPYGDGHTAVHSVVNLTVFTAAYHGTGTWTDSYYTKPA